MGFLFSLFHSIKNGGACTSSQSLLFLSFAVDSSSLTSHFYVPKSGKNLLFLTVAARALKSREEWALLCKFFSRKLHGYGSVCFQREWKFQYQAVNLKSPGSLQPMLYKLNTCPPSFNRAWTMMLPINRQVGSPHCAFHRVYTCKGGCNWLGPRRLAKFHAGSRGGGEQGQRTDSAGSARQLCKLLVVCKSFCRFPAWKVSLGYFTTEGNSLAYFIFSPNRKTFAKCLLRPLCYNVLVSSLQRY